MAASHLKRRYFWKRRAQGGTCRKDTYCFHLSGVTGLGQADSIRAHNYEVTRKR
jgi:hypothetical protein